MSLPRRWTFAAAAAAAAAASLTLGLAAASGAQAAPITEVQATTTAASLTDAITTGPGGAVYATVRFGASTYSIANLSVTPPVLTQCNYQGQSCALGGITSTPDSIWFIDTVPINAQGGVTAPPSIGQLAQADTGLAAGLVQGLGYTALPYGIASDPTGALWVADGQGVIDRYVPGDTDLTAYPLPISNAGPLLIVQGPDDAMWFTQTGNNTIGRVSTGGAEPMGTITAYAVPTPRAGLYGIAAGPDGAMWFTEARTGRLGRITADGQVTEFQIPIKAAAPRGIVAGPDGALWFTDPGTNAVGRMTPGGAVTEYPLKTANSVPSAITVGGDGALWFTESGNKASVGRLDPASPPVAAARARAVRVGATVPKKKAAAKKKKKATKKKAAAKKKSRR